MEWGEGTRLVILDSPYRLMIEPLLSYVEEILAAPPAQRTPDDRRPRFVPHHLWHNLLHSNTAAFLRLALLFRPGIIITDVPFYVE